MSWIKLIIANHAVTSCVNVRVASQKKERVSHWSDKTHTHSSGTECFTFVAQKIHVRTVACSLPLTYMHIKWKYVSSDAYV